MTTPLRPFLAQLFSLLTLAGRSSHVLITFYHAVDGAFARLLGPFWPLLTLVGRFARVLNTSYHVVCNAFAPLLGPTLPPVDSRRALRTLIPPLESSTLIPPTGFSLSEDVDTTPSLILTEYGLNLRVLSISTLAGRFSHVLSTFYHAVGDAFARLLGPTLPPVEPRRALLRVLSMFCHAVGDAFAPLLGPTLPP